MRLLLDIQFNPGHTMDHSDLGETTRDHWATLQALNPDGDKQALLAVAAGRAIADEIQNLLDSLGMDYGHVKRLTFRIEEEPCSARTSGIGTKVT